MNVSRLELIKLISQRLLTREVSDPKEVGRAVLVMNGIASCSDAWLDANKQHIGRYSGLTFRCSARRNGASRIMERLPVSGMDIAKGHDAHAVNERAFKVRTPKSVFKAKSRGRRR